MIETNTLDYISAAILSQYDNLGIFHSIKFYSKKHNSVEYNYEIYNK